MHKWFDSLMYISSGYVLDMFSDIRIPLNVVWYLVYNEYIAHDTTSDIWTNNATLHDMCMCVCYCVHWCQCMASECTSQCLCVGSHFHTVSATGFYFSLYMLTTDIMWCCWYVYIHNVLFTYSSGVRSMAHISLHVLFSTIDNGRRLHNETCRTGGEGLAKI